MILAIRDRMGKREEGFTLIELLVVVIIIGILAAIAIPTFLNQRERGWQAGVVSDVRNAALEVEAYITGSPGNLPPANQAGFDALGVTRTAPQTTLTYIVDGTNFCVQGNDSRLSNGPFTYDSSANGMLDNGQACTL